MKAPDHSHEPVMLRKYHRTLRNREWLLLPISLAALGGGGMIVAALVKWMLA